MAAAQVRALARNTPVSTFINIFASIVLLLILWGHVPDAMLLIWTGLVQANAFYHLIRWYRRRHSEFPTSLPTIVPRRLALQAGATGVIWGVGGLILYLHAPVELEIVPIFIALALACGSPATLGPVREAAQGFILTVFVPLALALAYRGDWPHLSLALFLVVLAMVLVTVSHNVFVNFQENLQATLEVERLLGSESMRQAEILEISHGSDAFALFDPNEKLLLWNERFQEIFAFPRGMLRRGVSLGETLELSQPPVDVARGPLSRADWIDQTLGRLGEAESTVTEQYEDGKWIRGSFRRNPSGNISSVYTDVTTLIQNQQELERTYEELKIKHEEVEAQSAELRLARDKAMSADKAKTLFLANMSHELRTPLNAIIGFAEVLQKEIVGPLNEQQLEYISNIEEAGGHFLSIINDLLDLSRIEAGTMNLYEEWCDLRRIGESAAQMVQPKAAEKSIEIAVDIPETLPELYIDQRKVRQMLINLVTNAIKFSGKECEIRLSAKVAPDRGMIIEVSDQGFGMSAEQIPTAFEAFGQIDAGYTTTNDGVGLGLSITKALIELHGGAIRIRSVPGQGTTVELRLPPRRVRRAVAAETDQAVG